MQKRKFIMSPRICDVVTKNKICTLEQPCACAVKKPCITFDSPKLKYSSSVCAEKWLQYPTQIPKSTDAADP